LGVGVGFFTQHKKNHQNPTVMESMREPGSLTHPLVTPIEGQGADSPHPFLRKKVF
jgi:hypothetical protein